MKNIFLSFVLFLLVWPLWAQQPQAISYQTVIRDADGQLLPDNPVSLKITLRVGSVTGEVAYSETHNAVTNSFGLITLSIGQGTPVEGNFESIQWGRSPLFLETAIYLTGSGQFQTLGVTQLLSVPYSMYSGQTGSLMAMTTEERDALQNPPVGMQIYNSTSNCLNYFNGTAWFETCGQCTPLPSQANAGDDQYFDDATFSAFLQGNIPVNGTGTWTVENGTGGSFSDANDPQTLFTGQLCENYTLKWTIGTACASTSDNVNISFDATPTLADAGQDAIITTEALSLNLAANTPEMGVGQWTIFSGEGGTLASSGSPGTLFTGQTCTTYVLVWKISTPCHTSSDTVVVTFFTTPTPANAGNDQTIPQLTYTTLAANTPLIGQGQWTIIQGTGGQLLTPNSPNSLFLGQPNSLYILQWKITSVCTNSTDEVQIIFGCAPQPTTANAGPDQLNLAGTSATLQGNTPVYGTGQWNIVSGAGGNIANPENPTSNFTGQIGITYELRWTISNNCGSNNDHVIISFITCGLNFTDARDGQSYSTLQIGAQCWMKQNLNVGTRIAGTSNQTNNSTIEKYCYNNTENNCTSYGGLYQWNEMMQYITTAGVKGICPTGWHLPTDAEWTTLTTYISGQSAYRCNSNSSYIAKSMASTSGWTTYTGTCAVGNNQASNNTTGFTGLPAGYRGTDGSFGNQSYDVHWWSSSQNDSSDAWYRYMYYVTANVSRNYDSKAYGFSVRCLMD